MTVSGTGFAPLKPFGIFIGGFTVLLSDESTIGPDGSFSATVVVPEMRPDLYELVVIADGERAWTRFAVVGEDETTDPATTPALTWQDCAIADLMSDSLDLQKTAIVKASFPWAQVENPDFATTYAMDSLKELVCPSPQIFELIREASWLAQTPQITEALALEALETLVDNYNQVVMTERIDFELAIGPLLVAVWEAQWLWDGVSAEEATYLLNMSEVIYEPGQIVRAIENPADPSHSEMARMHSPGQLGDERVSEIVSRLPWAQGEGIDFVTLRAVDLLRRIRETQSTGIRPDTGQSLAGGKAERCGLSQSGGIHCDSQRLHRR